MKLGEKLLKLRIGRGMTQQELADKLYVTRTAVSKWENDKDYPAIDSLKLISQFYGVSIDELVSDEDVINVRRFRQKHSRIFYICAACCLLATAAFAFAAFFSGIPWLIIPSAAAAAAYVAFALLSKSSLKELSRRDFVIHAISRAVGAAVIMFALITTLVQTFA